MLTNLSKADSEPNHLRMQRLMTSRSQSSLLCDPPCSSGTGRLGRETCATGQACSPQLRSSSASNGQQSDSKRCKGQRKSPSQVEGRQKDSPESASRREPRNAVVELVPSIVGLMTNLLARRNLKVCSCRDTPRPPSRVRPSIWFS